MAEPEAIKTTPVKTEAYVQVNAGAYDASKGDLKTDIGARLGGEVEKGGTYAKAEVGYGTALRANLEAGHEFNIGKNMGLELSANAQYLRDNSESSYSSTITHSVNSTPYESSIKKGWHDGFKKLGASAMLNFKGKAGNIKFGVEGGYRTNNAPDISNTLHTEVTNENKTEIREDTIMIKGRRSGAYVTPKVSAELNLGKNSHWALTANADKFQGSAGIKYTF